MTIGERIISEEATIQSALGKQNIRIMGLRQATAFLLFHELVLELDQHPTLSMSYRSREQLEFVTSQTLQRSRPFPYELRPAEANCAVRIQPDGADTFMVYADLRNEFEDNPRLGGGDHLQRSFSVVIDSELIEG